MQQPCTAREAFALKYPEPIVVVVARDAAGKCNPMTVGWSMICSANPPMFAMGIGNDQYTLKAIRRSREFVVAFPAEAQADDVLFFGTHSGGDLDKLERTGTATAPAEVVGAVILVGAVANFECKVAGLFEAGDHTIVTGEVVKAWRNTEPTRRLYTIGEGYKFAAVDRAEEK